MKLTALRLFKVRRFQARGIAIEDIGDGVNVLSAANEYGKSTCFDALHALFFQPHTGTPNAVKVLRPYSGGSPIIEADIITDKGRFRLSKRFCSGKHAIITDLSTTRPVAQADEAEAFIAELIRGGTAGPAGLLWVRQGITGVERLSKSEEGEEQKAREDVLSSVRGEIESMTGGRRMAAALRLCEDDLSALVTSTLKPKSGGPYNIALEEQDRLLSAEQKLSQDVRALREKLDERRRLTARAIELAAPDEVLERRKKLETAQNVHDEAKSSSELLKTKEQKAKLCRNYHESALKEFDAYNKSLVQYVESRKKADEAERARSELLERQTILRSAHESANNEVEKAEREEREARDLLQRLNQALRARAAHEKMQTRHESLKKAEAARKSVEDGEAALRALGTPEKSILALTALEVEIAGLRALEMAQAPRLTMDYIPGVTPSVIVNGTVLADGEERPLPGITRIELPAIGTLTLRSERKDAGHEAVSLAENKYRGFLQELGVNSLTEARERQAAIAQKREEISQVKFELSHHAPMGIPALSEEIAKLESHTKLEFEIKGDSVQMEESVKVKTKLVSKTRAALQELQPQMKHTQDKLIEVEKSLAGLEVALCSLYTFLGPVAERDQRLSTLDALYSKHKSELLAADKDVQDIRAGMIDITNTAAALSRANSVVDAADKESSELEKRLAGLNGEIITRAAASVEEEWQETSEKLMAAQSRVKGFEREVAVLVALKAALEGARSVSRDHYFEPIVRELRPLTQLLFDDALVQFDPKTHLPVSILRNGLEEQIDVLSGGAREQLAVLTRLAFARLLAKEGRAAPVVLDDALVYSDDDRIEKMFDALHRQASEQQIIVFSCRQRAFAKLGGNRLTMVEWTPDVT